MKYKAFLRNIVLRPVIGGLVGIALLAITTLIPRKWSFSTTEPCQFTIYLTSDGFHTNFIVPVDTSIYSWRQHLNLNGIASNLATETPAKNYQYLQFGWGDRRFYTETPSWDKVQPMEALRALFFWQNTSALFVKGHSQVPHYANEQVKCLHLGKTDYLKLMNFINDSFQSSNIEQQNFPKTSRSQNLHQTKQRIASGQDQQSGFYAAKGYYSILRTCNTWTADGLRTANVNTPLWDGLANPVMAHIRNGCQCQ